MHDSENSDRIPPSFTKDVDQKGYLYLRELSQNHRSLLRTYALRFWNEVLRLAFTPLCSPRKPYSVSEKKKTKHCFAFTAALATGGLGPTISVCFCRISCGTSMSNHFRINPYGIKDVNRAQDSRSRLPPVRFSSNPPKSFTRDFPLCATTDLGKTPECAPPSFNGDLPESLLCIPIISSSKKTRRPNFQIGSAHSTRWPL
mmetsp:Transcript_28565/g.111803  ORF Transcript_28565/g.111803 Transcript_28565/m.111803 type:complete len:201 (-) Transcript_28565:833-1435(-)